MTLCDLDLVTLQYPNCLQQIMETKAKQFFCKLVWFPPTVIIKEKMLQNVQIPQL